MVNKSTEIFSSVLGKDLYHKIERAVSEHNMLEKLKGGVLVGFSGGADSALLLLYILELSKRNGDFPILAVHINHMIRGEEADRDEEFSRNFAKSLGVQFISSKVDVPKIASESSIGLEEAARNARYSKFQDIIDGRNDISCIALAHNATDNVETVLLNLLRGAGTRGAAGIPPVRDNIVRPLIFLPKRDIVHLLDCERIEYMTDSTNSSDDYSRNYIRNNVIPHLSSLSSNPEGSFERLSRNLRSDDEYITEEARAFLNNRNRILTSELRELHKSLLHRVLTIMASEYSITLENVHVDAIYENLFKDNFECTLAKGVRFVSERGTSYMTDSSYDDISYSYEIDKGKTEIPEYNADFYLTDEKVNKTFLKVYKKSIQADLSSAIICGRLFIRPKRDGDSVFYGGITRKLKKLFNDRKIPISKRPLIPVLCDDKGVVWVPGFGVRDDGKNDGCGPYATLAIKDSCETEGHSFFYGERNK